MFRKVLIANRGEVAVRVIRTCRALGIETVAVCSDADRDSLHVRRADSVIHLGPPPLAESYLSQDALLSAVRESGADAVHPGYGLLSENAGFAARVRAAGVAFIGPDTSSLEIFGDKLRARALARSLGIAPPPGTETAIDPADAEALSRAGEAIGYPLLVKATGGGGGIGMLRVDAPEALPGAALQCSQRGKAAFADDRVYLEKYLDRPRHVEVQILGDAQGKSHVVGERECSVQRRHQKLVEECPSPAGFLAASGSGRERLHQDAQRLVESQRYTGLATVEMVVDAGGQAYFLEVNPRLQVEHGITEMVFGIDLVALQLEAIAGEACSLPPSLQGSGHALEVRLYAEDPAKNFMPQPGRLERFDFPSPSPRLRIDTGFVEGDVVTPYYDPLLAKIMARGDTREDALALLRDALAESRVSLAGRLGPKQTNLALLRQVLDSAAFRSGNYTTHLLSEMRA